MSTTFRAAWIVLGLAVAASAEAIKELRTFYFGNCFLENSMPGLHPLLGKKARQGPGQFQRCAPKVARGHSQ